MSSSSVRDPCPTNTIGWGYSDTQFEITKDGQVCVAGRRYVISGHTLPGVLPFFNEALGIEITAKRFHEVDQKAVLNKLACSVVKRKPLDIDVEHTVDAIPRIGCSHGHTVEEMHALITGKGFPHVVDAVFYPKTEDEVVRIVKLAWEQGSRLVPVGGGTNVSGALLQKGKRTSWAVDMSKYMNKVIEVDHANNLAWAQAGARGVELDKMLAKEGVCSGHEPDSNEFSTLGGWIATNASGMKKNRYGNIEDIVQTVRWVSPEGTIVEEARAQPRASDGPKVTRLIIGSEGQAGIILSAGFTIRVLPECRTYESILLPNFSTGLEVLRAIQESDLVPASVRLMDNLQFKFGRAFKPAGGSWLKKTLERLYVTKWLGFDPDSMVVATVVFEGTTARVSHERAMVADIAKKYGGMLAGPEHGHTGYNMTFAIAYIRDFALKLDIMGESFETSCQWTCIEPIIAAVRRAVDEGQEEYKIVGKPFLTARISQIYPTGVCIYFYYGFAGDGLEEPARVYNIIYHNCRQAILDAGGSISHHHGVGQDRLEFFPQIRTSAGHKMHTSIVESLGGEKGVFRMQ